MFDHLSLGYSACDRLGQNWHSTFDHLGLGYGAFDLLAAKEHSHYWALAGKQCHLKFESLDSSLEFSLLQNHGDIL